MLINHLGMTGSWRFGSSGQKLEKHDHVALNFSDGTYLIFKDPRRFGYFDLLPLHEEPESSWFHHLGPEPLDPQKFNIEYLAQKSRGKSAPIKNFIMNQEVVVGVGNIYASEALFRAGIRPTRPAGRLKLEERQRLVKAIQETLKESIEKGGTTIRDFVTTEGDKGYFVQSLRVYDRGGEACVQCGGRIQSSRMAGRSTYWCKRCQK